MRKCFIREEDRGQGAFACAAVFLLSLVLVYGMVASSLLVECLPGDGACLIELIGDDPCRFPAFGDGAEGAHDHSPLLLGEVESDQEPCVDMGMDNLGVTRAIASLLSPFAPLTDQPGSAAAISGRIQDPSTLSVLFKLAREPVIGADFDLALPLPLRI